eukprot:tig00020904_g15239.t1
MFGGRKANYEEAPEESTLDNLSKKLASDLRTNIRKLANHPCMSREWLEMADSLQKISNVAAMEQRMPKRAEESTLWEREELTVRFLLEEGKLNMCLRVLNEFKSSTRNVATRRALIDKGSRELSVPADELERRLEAFEQNLGLLLSCAFKSVESLQTLDTPLLIKHCGEVFSFVVEDSESMLGKTGVSLERCQETLCLSYLLSMARKFEALANEDRIMDLVEEHKVLPNLTSFLHRFHGLYKAALPSFLVDALDFLTLACDTEHFSTHKSKHFPKDEQMKLAWELRAAFIDEQLVDLAARKRFQPLLDTLNQFKNKLRL